MVARCGQQPNPQDDRGHMRLVRTDDTSKYWWFIPDSISGNTFTILAALGGIIEYGNNLSPNRWSSKHWPPQQLNLYDENPPDGLITYRLEWRIKTGSAALAGLSHKPGTCVFSALGRKA